VLDPHGPRLLDRHRLLGRAEVAVAHRRDMRARARRPGTHRVWMLARVGLDRGGRSTIGVALAQHRVDRAPLDPVVAHAVRPLFVAGRLIGVVGDRVALALKFGDRRLQLRQRGADVRQLDDVGLRRLRQLAELAERVRNALLRREPLRELRENPGGERDIARLDLNVRRGGERLEHREQRLRRERRSLVGDRVEDLHARMTLSHGRLAARTRRQ
jgi:hypothetical protein